MRVRIIIEADVEPIDRDLTENDSDDLIMEEAVEGFLWDLSGNAELIQWDYV